MGPSSDRMLTIVGVISTIVLLSSLTYEFLLHEENEVSFSIDNSDMIEDIDRIASFGPRVVGSTEENLATEYISQRFTEIGLENVKVEEFQVTGAWFVDADPDEHQILMHAQLEQGLQNGPGLPDGTAGTGRVAIDETGELNHIESFTFFMKQDCITLEIACQRLNALFPRNICPVTFSISCEFTNPNIEQVILWKRGGCTAIGWLP